MKLQNVGRALAAVGLAVVTLFSVPLPAGAAGSTGVLFHSDRDGDNEVYLANATTGQLLKKLTNNTKDQDESPSWRPQGDQFVYTSYNVTTSTPSQLFVKTISTGQVRQLTDNLQLSYEQPVFSPDGQKVAVVTNDAARQSCLRLITIGAATTTETILRCAPQGIGYELPAWSPDGQKIMLTVFEETGPSRYVLKLSTNAFELLIPGAYTGVWSPNGSKIAFTRLRMLPTDVEQVYLANADGTNAQAITNDPARSRRAVAWYPSGTRILTISFKDDSPVGLRSINTSGGGEFVFPRVGMANDFATVNSVR